VPNLGPIILVLGFVGWRGIHFDLFTLLIGGIAIGLAVDDTIHFMHNFYRYFRQSGDAHRAVRQTLETTGQAMLVTSIVLCCGFFSYMLAELNNLFYFGLLTGLAIALAFIADVIVCPALVALATRGEQSEGGSSHLLGGRSPSQGRQPSPTAGQEGLHRPEAPSDGGSCKRCREFRHRSAPPWSAPGRG
jgi:multidrug efflux pump subunit AcrB